MSKYHKDGTFKPVAKYACSALCALAAIPDCRDCGGHSRVTIFTDRYDGNARGKSYLNVKRCYDMKMLEIYDRR